MYGMYHIPARQWYSAFRCLTSDDKLGGRIVIREILLNDTCFSVEIMYILGHQNILPKHSRRPTDSNIADIFQEQIGHYIIVYQLILTGPGSAQYDKINLNLKISNMVIGCS